MKPGDLVKIREMLSNGDGIKYVYVYKTLEGPGGVWQWHPGVVALLMEGHSEIDSMKQVLHGGLIGWVDEDCIEVIDEAR